MVSSRSVAFVFLLVYIYGLYLTQSVHLHRLETGKLTDSVEFELVQCEANYIYDVRLLWDIIGRVWQWKKEATNSSQTQFKCLFFFVSRFLKSSFMVNHACSTPIMVQMHHHPFTKTVNAVGCRAKGRRWRSLGRIFWDCRGTWLRPFMVALEGFPPVPRSDVPSCLCSKLWPEALRCFVLFFDGCLVMCFCVVCVVFVCFRAAVF